MHVPAVQNAGIPPNLYWRRMYGQKETDELLVSADDYLHVKTVISYNKIKQHADGNITLCDSAFAQKLDKKITDLLKSYFETKERR